MSPRFIGDVVALLGNGITICWMILVGVKCLSGDVGALHCRKGEMAPKRHLEHVSSFLPRTNLIKGSFKVKHAMFVCIFF